MGFMLKIKCIFCLPSLLMLAILLPSASFAQIKNELQGHPSPYLQMHANDPVAWQQWGPGVLERAQKEGKLIYLSIGYFPCHWCHVMHRESYSDADIAKIMNKYFLPVKVDRELRPALDERMIAFVEKLRGNAGWPLNVFLTPEGYPLTGVTYLPKESFQRLLAQLATRWQDDREELETAAKKAFLQMQKETEPLLLFVNISLPFDLIAIFLASKALEIVVSGFFKASSLLGAVNKFVLINPLGKS